MIQNSAFATLPPSNIDIEIELLGSILLDPNAIHQVAEILPVEAFYLESHQQIYRACLKLYKQQLPVNTLTITSWLIDNNLLHEIGGKNKLVQLVNTAVSSVNVSYFAELLIEKHVRRQLGKLRNELDVAEHDTEKPLSWILENIEAKVLNVTQLRNATKKGYWQKIDDIAFERLCKELEEIEEIENAAQRDWLMKKLAKKWKFSSKKELLDFHAKWLDSQSKTKLYTAKEYFAKYGNQEQEWVVPGLVPTQSVVVAYGDGGVGKTRFAFTLAKHACAGGKFTYDGAEIDPMKVLLVETDQGARNTSKLLEMQDFFEDELVSDRLAICEEWSVGEFGRLRQMLKQHSPQLVVIDSLMSVSTSSIYSENDTEYARPIVRLRHLAQEFNCTFFIIHHCNANGEIRGTRAIKFACDELWKLTRQRNEIEEFNVLSIEKSRSRGPGAYKFKYDDETWGWEFSGRMEDSAVFGQENQSTNMSRCIHFLKNHRGIPFEAQEVASALGINLASVRRDLKRAVNEGLVNSGKSQVNKRALVYYMGARYYNFPSDQVINASDQPLITSSALQDEGYRLSDQVISENSMLHNLKSENSSDHFDHLITSTPNEDAVINASDQPQVITSDQLITCEPKIEELVDHLSQSVTLPEPPQAREIESKRTHNKIEEGSIYLSKSLGKQVKVIKLYSSVKKADVYIAGDPFAKARLFFSDLYPLPEDPWTPNTGRLAKHGDELVEIVGFENRGQSFQIEYASGRREFVKRNKLKHPLDKS